MNLHISSDEIDGETEVVTQPGSTPNLTDYGVKLYLKPSPRFNEGPDGPDEEGRPFIVFWVPGEGGHDFATVGNALHDLGEKLSEAKSTALAEQR